MDNRRWSIILHWSMLFLNVPQRSNYISWLSSIQESHFSQQLSSVARVLEEFKWGTGVIYRASFSFSGKGLGHTHWCMGLAYSWLCAQETIWGDKDWTQVTMYKANTLLAVLFLQSLQVYLSMGNSDFQNEVGKDHFQKLSFRIWCFQNDIKKISMFLI